MELVNIKFSIAYRPTGEEVDLPIAWICHEYSSIAFCAKINSDYDGIDSLPGAPMDYDPANYDIYVYINGEKHIYTGPFMHGCREVQI